MLQCANALQGVGLLVPKRFGPSDLDTVVGFVVDKKPARLRLSAKRRALLYEALLELTRNDLVHIDALRSATSVWVWAALLRRELLAIPHNVFRFLETFESHGTVRWWRVARLEVRRMATALLGCWADVGASWI